MEKRYIPDNGFEGLKKSLNADLPKARPAPPSPSARSGPAEKIVPRPEAYTNQDMDKAMQDAKSGPVFSRLNGMLTGVLIICLAGFSFSNWMMHKQVALLATRVTNTQSRLVKITDTEKVRKRMESRIASLEDGFRKIRIRLRRQSGGEGTTKFRLRLAKAEKAINRLELSMAGTMGRRKKEARRTKQILAGRKPEPRTARVTKKMSQSASTSRTPTQASALHTQARKDSGHTWVVNLAARHSESTANDELKKMRKSGIMAEKHTVERQGRKYWRLRVAGFRSLKAARKFIRDVAAKHGYKGTWIARGSNP